MSVSYLGDIGVATVIVGDMGSGITGEAAIAIKGIELKAGDGSCGFQNLLGQTGRAALALRELGGGVVDVFTTGGGATPNLWKSHLQDKGWSNGSNLTFVAPPTLRPVSGLFIDGTLVGGTASDGVFAVNAAVNFSLTTPVFTQASAPAASPPAVGSGYLLFGDTSGQLHKVTYTPAGVFGPPLAVGAATGESIAAPIIGASGLVYAVGSKGSLAVRKSNDLSAAWATTSLVTAVTSVGHPALDVYRDATGAKVCDKGLGVLYFSTFDGSATNLIAVLVDSNGLEPTAPWPKYQRDNGNTGNFSRTLSPWTCP